jgi:hypothetical protein
VPERDRPLDHLARGLEELMRAGAEALALWRERGARGDGEEAFARTLEQLMSGLSGWLDQDDGRWLEALRSALRLEVQRWEDRAGADPAAARVRDLFAAALDLLSTDEDRERGPARSRRPPQRKATR